MKKIKIIIQLVLFAIIILLCTKVSAASIVLAPNKSTVTVDDEFTISMNLSGASLASLNVKITVDTSKVEYISSNVPDNTNFNNGKILYTWTDLSGGENPKTDGTIVTFKFKAISSGTASFSISGNFYDADENSVNMSLSGVSVNINEASSVTSPDTNSEENNTQQSEENNTQTSENQSPSNEEDENINQDNNNDNEQYINNNSSQLSSNTFLQSLRVNIEGISPQFNKNTTKYYLMVDETIDNIKVEAEPEDTNASVSITGNTNLKIGTNTITVLVTAQNGTSQRKYLIDVSKTDDPNNANTNLENLAIENATLNPEFSADILEYSTTVGSDSETINILAVPEIEEASVIVTGADRLSYGDNIITISVTAKNGTSVKVYTVNVYRKTETEEIEEQNRLLEEENTENNIILDNTIIPNDTLYNKNNTILWLIFIILIFIVIGIIVYLIIKKKNRKG